MNNAKIETHPVSVATDLNSGAPTEPNIHDALVPCAQSPEQSGMQALTPDAAQHSGANILHPPHQRAPHLRERNGKIARLPKLERDMVNRMLHQNVNHHRIVGALDELGIKVTRRNISNWKTHGGYKEWCLDQERQINLSRIQDNLIDYLRKNDASQLPEVGLQVAATQLSHMLLQPETAQQLAAHPEQFRHVVEMLCRLTTQIQSLQKDRDQAVRKAGIRNTAEHTKHLQEKDIDDLRRVYSGKMLKSIRDPEVPHRNELPKRDELPIREAPANPDPLELLRQLTAKAPKITAGAV